MAVAGLPLSVFPIVSSIALALYSASTASRNFSFENKNVASVTAFNQLNELMIVMDIFMP